VSGPIARDANMQLLLLSRDLPQHNKVERHDQGRQTRLLLEESVKRQMRK
jgi:hypothetical protein